jgi:hypothetical protein
MSEDTGKSLFETHEIINEPVQEPVQEPIKEAEDQPKVRIAAFDVGIKTLSFTILEYILDSDRPPKIISWRVLNLLDQNDDGCIHTCLLDGCDKDAIRGREYCTKHLAGKDCIYKYGGRSKKSGTLCGAKTYLTSDYCKSHLPKDHGDIESICQYLFIKGDAKLKMCGKKCINTEYCKAHVNTANSKRYKKIVAKLKQRPSRMSDSTLAATLARRLDQFPELLTANKVLIENQPKINGRMKKLSLWLHMYFIMRGIVDANHFEKVIFLSAKHKLKMQPPGLQLERNNTYEHRKDNAIKICEFMISNSKKHSEYFKTLRKKDDLADSFLMCYYYLKTYYIRDNIK